MKTSRAIALVATLAGLAAPTSSTAVGLADTVWPMFQHDPQHTGRADVSGPQGPDIQIEWAYKGRSKWRGGLSVGEDGMIYAPNSRGPLIGVDPILGEKVCGFQGPSGQLGDRSQPAIADDGTVYIGARDNDLHSFQSDCDIRNWRFSVPKDGDVTTPPTIGPDGTIYMGSGALGAGWFYAMNPDGTPKWLNITGLGIENMSPALSLDGSTVFVNLKREALAIDTTTGLDVWRVPIAQKGFNKKANYSPVVLSDGSAVLFNSKEGLWALDPTDGSEVWRFVPPGDQELKSAPALGADNTIYFGASRKKKNSTFYALDPSDGSIIWKHQHIDRGRYDNNQAVVGADGKVYVPHGRLLFAFDGAGDGNGGSVVLWSMFFRGRFESGAVIGGPGVLYFAAGKYLHKLTD